MVAGLSRRECEDGKVEVVVVVVVVSEMVDGSWLNMSAVGRKKIIIKLER